MNIQKTLNNIIKLTLVLILMLLLFACGGGSSGSSGNAGGGGGGGGGLLAQKAPTYDRHNGYFIDGKSIDIVITAEVAGSEISYTTDGVTDPVCTGGLPASPLTVTINNNSETIKARSCLSGYDDSPVATSVYTAVDPDVNVDPLSSNTPIADAIFIANDGDIVNVPVGIYTENLGELNINNSITLIGQGSGSDPATNTIIANGVGNGVYVVRLSVGGTVGAPTALRNLRIINGTGNPGNDSTGIMVTASSGYFELDNVVAADNGGDGLAFNPGGSPHYAGFVVKNNDFSGNGNHGFRIPTYVSVDLTIDNSSFSNNVGSGFLTYSTDLPATDISITNSTFYNNASSVHQLADISISYLAGTLNISDVSIISNAADSGIRITGSGTGSSPNKTGTIAANNMTLTNVTISGTQQSNGAYPPGAMVVTRYTGLANLVMSNVIMNSTAPHGLFLGTITPGAGPDLGNLELGVGYTNAIALGKHGNSSSYIATNIAIDATGTTFVNAVSDADIMSRIWDDDDGSLGSVTRPTP